MNDVTWLNVRHASTGADWSAPRHSSLRLALLDVNQKRWAATPRRRPAPPTRSHALRHWWARLINLPAIGPRSCQSRPSSPPREPR